MSEPRLVTVTEAAKWLGVSNWRMYQLARNGEVRSVRVGRLLRFRLVWLAAYAEANATGPEVGDVEGLWSRDRLPEEWEVGGDVGAPTAGRQAPKGHPDRGHRGRGMEADAGGPARRGTVELQVAKEDRQRGFVPRRVAS